MMAAALTHNEATASGRATRIGSAVPASWPAVNPNRGRPSRSPDRQPPPEARDREGRSIAGPLDAGGPSGPRPPRPTAGRPACTAPSRGLPDATPSRGGASLRAKVLRLLLLLA